METFNLLSVISEEYQKILGKNLCGIYIHGSLAFGCFNWDKSDIDFLVVVYDELTQDQKESMISVLLCLNHTAPPKGFEMSVILFRDCVHFHYPTPFLLHYSNAYTKKAETNLFEYCRTMHGLDEDLAAHFTVVKKVGMVLCGKPIEEVFGEVPKSDYLASIQSDIEDAEKEIVRDPVYMTLNLCRVLAFVKDGLVLSKEEGAMWAMHYLNEYCDFISKTLNCYKTNNDCIVDADQGQKFACYMKKMIF